MIIIVETSILSRPGFRWEVDIQLSDGIGEGNTIIGHYDWSVHVLPTNRLPCALECNPANVPVVKNG